MKVLHAAETIQGGIATVLRQLLIWQENSKDYESVTCIFPESQKEHLDGVVKTNRIAFKRKGRDIFSLLSFTFCFTRTFFKLKPDVVHIHSTFAGILARIIVFLSSPMIKTQVVYCPHAFSFLMSKNNRLKENLFVFIEKLMAKITHKIVCVSDYEYQAAIKNGLPSQKLVTIYNGVAPCTIDSEQLINPMPEGKINLLYIGRFDYQKGYDLLIEAMSNLEGTNFHLTAIGSGVLSQNEYNDRDNISYTGWLPYSKIVQYLNFAHVLVIPSRWEGFAMVPLEAMNFSLPIIASNTTSFPEVVIDGQSGLIFNIDENNALSNAIRKYDANKFNEMGKEGRRRLERYFNAEQMILKTHHLYVSLLQKIS